MKSFESIVQAAVKTIEEEASMVLNLKKYINKDFVDTVELVLNMKGRVIITGIGKSAHIGQKIVATLNSTGTPAVFMHAADAIHGDIGIIQKNDAVICISKSGNTNEIKVLVPLIKMMGNKIVAMTGNAKSYLAESADLVLLTTVEKEVCPNNLAPTSSTTAQLVMGDALAVCLLQSRGFSREDFAKLHPGGMLGKNLYLKVGDLMTRNEIPIVSKDADIKQVILEMTSKRLGATAVAENDKTLYGIITDGDLRRMLEKSNDISTLRAHHIATPNPKTITKDMFAVKALALMKAHNITQIIVAENKMVVGFIHLHDILREGII